VELGLKLLLYNLLPLSASFKTKQKNFMMMVIHVKRFILLHMPQCNWAFTTTLLMDHSGES